MNASASATSFLCPLIFSEDPYARFTRECNSSTQKAPRKAASEVSFRPELARGAEPGLGDDLGGLETPEESLLGGLLDSTIGSESDDIDA